MVSHGILLLCVNIISPVNKTILITLLTIVNWFYFFSTFISWLLCSHSCLDHYTLSAWWLWITHSPLHNTISLPRSSLLPSQCDKWLTPSSEGLRQTCAVRVNSWESSPSHLFFNVIKLREVLIVFTPYQFNSSIPPSKWCYNKQ